jgi:hypothetical protein
VFFWVCGVATALCLMVAAFAGVMYAITGKPHDATLGLVYLGYATVPFMVTFILAYYRRKFTGARRQRQTLRQIDGLRLALDQRSGQRARLKIPINMIKYDFVGGQPWLRSSD